MNRIKNTRNTGMSHDPLPNSPLRFPPYLREIIKELFLFSFQKIIYNFARRKRNYLFIKSNHDRNTEKSHASIMMDISRNLSARLVLTICRYRWRQQTFPLPKKLDPIT